MSETTNAVVLQTKKAGVVVLENRVAHAVRLRESDATVHGVSPEATRRVQPGHVRHGHREGGQEHQGLVHFFTPAVGAAAAAGVVVAVAVGGQFRDGKGDEGRHDVGKDGGHEQQGVDGGEPVPAAPGGVGSHESEQVEQHDEAQQHGDRALALLVQGEDEEAHHERRRERRGVAVVEHQVAPVLGVREDGVAHGVPLQRVLPHAPRQVQPRGVRHRRHQGGQQQQVLLQLVLRRRLWLVFLSL